MAEENEYEIVEEELDQNKLLNHGGSVAEGEDLDEQFFGDSRGSPTSSPVSAPRLKLNSEESPDHTLNGSDAPPLSPVQRFLRAAGSPARVIKR